MRRTVWDQGRSVGLEEERGWNIATVYAYPNVVIYEVRQSHGPHQELQTLISAEEYKEVSLNFSLLAKGVLQQQRSCKGRWGERGGWYPTMVNLEQLTLTV